MLKISQAGTPNQCVTLKLEVRVVGPWVEELRRICEPLLSNGDQLKLDLSDVSFVDGEGIAAISDLKSHGVQLSNCSPFVEQQIKRSS